MKNKKTLLPAILLVTFLFSGEIYSQDFWAQFGLDSIIIVSMGVSADSAIFAGTDGGTQYASLYQSIDNGFTWARRDSGMNWAASIYNIAVSPNGYIFADAYRSNDDGHSWSYLPNGAPLNLKDIKVDDRGVVYYASMSDGLFLSYDNGDTLINITNDLGNTSVYSVLPASNGYLYAGTHSDLYRSIDEGATWTAMGLGLAPQVGALAEGPNGEIIACTTSGIYISTDYGDSWVTKFGSGQYTSIATNSAGTIYVGVQYNGVIRSTDNGDNWEWLNDGLTNYFVEPVVISNGFVFAGTRDGVFRGTDALATVKENEPQNPEKFILSQNYPNPFNPSTTIAYNLPESGNVRLTVYDLSGRKVRTLVNEQQTAGQFKIVWNGKDDHNLPVATGVYFYRMKYGAFVKSVKLMLVK